MNNAIEILTKILQDNVGNRITVALANGMLHALSEEMARQTAIEDAKARGMHLEGLQGTIVKGTDIPG
jgi:hypothetical protein